jgi:uncharacterized protein YoxC
MSTLVEISIVVVAAFAVILILIAIPALIALAKAAREIMKLAESVRFQLAPFTHDLAVILAEAKKVSGSVSRQVGQIEDSMQRYKSFENSISVRLVKPLNDVLTLINGFLKGLRLVTGKEPSSRKRSRRYKR